MRDNILEQPLPPYGSCNLGSLDLSKFTNKNGIFNWELFSTAIQLSVRFLDSVIDRNHFPTKEIEETALRFRPIGLGVMGLADMYMKMGLAYGSEEALDILDAIMGYMKATGNYASEDLGHKKGIPEGCLKIYPKPRRNVTVLSIAPTGTISLIAGCNSGIEPFFSEITHRKDKTGRYVLNVEEASLPHFRCAVSSNGAQEVTWEEHVNTQAVAQKYVDSGVSKTINFPQGTHRDTIGRAFISAWEQGCKGITVYRNGSRAEEVLTPKNMKKDLCPVCGSPKERKDGCWSCTNPECDWELCVIG